MKEERMPSKWPSNIWGKDLNSYNNINVKVILCFTSMIVRYKKKAR